MEATEIFKDETYRCVYAYINDACIRVARHTVLLCLTDIFLHASTAHVGPLAKGPDEYGLSILVKTVRV